MQKVFYMLSNDQLLVIGVIAFVFGILLLSYLLTLILSSKKHKNAVLKKESIEDTNNSNHLEQVLNKMQETIDLKKEIDDVSLFEKEQEENAIISYQELVEAAKKDFPEFTYLKKNDVNLEPLVVGNSTADIRPEKKFKSSVFISPIYGVKDGIEQVQNEEIPLNNYEASKETEENNDQFLEKLKNFRNNL